MFTQRAILVVSFGTSYLDTLEKNIQQIENEIQKAYPDYRLYRAFTSHMIIKKLKTVNQISIDTVVEALDRMKQDGIKDILIQPTHIIHGVENDHMLRDVKSFEKDFQSIKIGTPLLSATADYLKVVDIITKYYSPTEKEALVLMGHGTDHHANASYPALSYTFKQKGFSNIFVGTVEGFPELDDILSLIHNTDIEFIKLLPFMLVAGDHAKNDMDGSDEDSWKSRFLEKGYQVQTIVKGLGEIEEIRDLYLQHLKAAIL